MYVGAVWYWAHNNSREKTNTENYKSKKGKQFARLQQVQKHCKTTPRQRGETAVAESENTNGSPRLKTISNY